MKKEIINKIFNIWLKDNPNPKTELTFVNNYTLLVAVVMSAQSTDLQVNKVTNELFKVADNPQDMVELGVENLKKYINKVGLFNSKAKNIIALSEILINKHQSNVPQSLEELEELPGVGRKTANVVMNCAFGAKTIGVDTHVFRLANRIGLAKGKTPTEIERKLLKKVPDEFKFYAHHWMILHGRYICKAQKPQCDICKIKNYCRFYLKKNSCL